MAEKKQFQQVQEASWDVVDSFREASQAVANNLVTIQELNLKFAQNIFLSWMELLTHQTESTRHLQQEWGQQSQKQQEAFQRLASSSMQLYMDFLLAPLSFSRQLVEVSESAVRRERERA